MSLNYIESVMFGPLIKLVRRSHKKIPFIWNNFYFTFSR